MIALFKNNQGLILLLLSGVALVILVAAVGLRPAADAADTSEQPSFYPFSAETLPEGTTLFEVDTTRSTAAFTIDEVLRGLPKTVIGTTDEVAGQLVIDLTNPQAARFSDFALLAETLRTDNSLRDSALRDRILFTNDHPLIVFASKQINGLPTSVAIGEPVSFSVVGMLNVSGETSEATFDVSATAVSPSEIHLKASTIINRSDYSIAIPNVPGVANVSEEVGVRLDLVLTAVEQ